MDAEWCKMTTRHAGRAGPACADRAGGCRDILLILQGPNMIFIHAARFTAGIVALAVALAAQAYPDKPVQYIIPSRPAANRTSRRACSSRCSRGSSTRRLIVLTSPAPAARWRGRS